MSNLREEINCFERTDLNGLCPNTNLLSFIESKAIKGERRSTYQCMPAVLNSLFFFFFFSRYFLLFFFFCFTSFPSQCLLLGYGFSQKFLLLQFFQSFIQYIARGPLYRACRDQYLLFQPLTAFIWCGCPYRPLTGRQLFNHHHLPVLVVSLPSARQRRLFCLFACRGFSTCYSVCALSLYLSWYAPSGSNSSLLLLGGMSSQQDISSKKG